MEFQGKIDICTYRRGGFYRLDVLEGESRFVLSEEGGKGGFTKDGLCLYLFPPATSRGGGKDYPGSVLRDGLPVLR